MKSEKLQDTLLDLYKKYSTYISHRELKNEFEDVIDSLGEGTATLEVEGKIGERICQFAEAQVIEFIQAINVSFLSELSSKMIAEVYSDEINFSKLCLSKSPEYDEIQKILRDIYVLVERNQRFREKSHHYLGVIKHALSYIKSLDKAFEIFISSFKSIDKKSRKELHENLLVDVKSCYGVLDDIRNDLVNIGEVISSRHNLLMRTESSIRLLSKYAEVDNFSNRGQSRNHTIEKGGGFSIVE